MRTRKFILAVAVVVIALFIIGILGNWETHYKRNGLVTEINGGIATIRDEYGEIWEYESLEFNVGDSVSIKLFDVGTSEVHDDVITEIKVVTR